MLWNNNIRNVIGIFLITFVVQTLSSQELIFSFDPRRVSVVDGAHLTELATPHFEGLQLNNITRFGKDIRAIICTAREMYFPFVVDFHTF